MSADSYIDNRHLRSNITLLLKYSTIIPFRHINNNKYKCLYCDLEVILFKKLKEHVTNNHKNIDEKYIFTCLKTPRDLIKADVSEIKCKLCGEKLKNLDNLITHLTSIHGKVYFGSRVKPNHGILGFDLSSEKFRCHICSAEFEFFKNLSSHMNDHSSDFMCHVCGKSFVSDHRLKTHVIMHRQKEVHCKICGGKFRTMSAKNHHTRKEHSKKFKCPECFANFEQYQHRLKHMVDFHGFKKPVFNCGVCKKGFASSGGLRAHVRYSHLRSVEYPCEVCGKIFFYKWIWERHMDVHSGAKNYECKFCSKKFAKPYTLRVHIRIHTNEKRFSCSLCPLAFIQKCSLKNHVKTHHPDSGIDLSQSL